MCRLIETIKTVNGQLLNLNYHNSRLNRSRKEIFDCKDLLDLNEIISVPRSCQTGIYKCRLIYSEKIHEIEFIPYLRRPVKSLKIIENNQINYAYKFENREELAKLFNCRQDCDDILIIKNNCITDTSFSNIVFYDGTRWITPSTPLLRGTQREKLLFEKKIFEGNIQLNDIKKVKKAKLINAMLEFEAEPIDIDKIIF